MRHSLHSKRPTSRARDRVWPTRRSPNATSVTSLRGTRGGRDGKWHPEPRVMVDNVKVRGRISDAVVLRETRKQHYWAIRKCYDAALAADQKLHGKVHVQFTIRHNGATKAARSVGKPTLDDPSCVTCIVHFVRRPQVPGPDPGRRRRYARYRFESRGSAREPPRGRPDRSWTRLARSSRCAGRRRRRCRAPDPALLPARSRACPLGLGTPRAARRYRCLGRRLRSRRVGVDLSRSRNDRMRHHHPPHRRLSCPQGRPPEAGHPVPVRTSQGTARPPLSHLGLDLVMADAASPV